MFYWIAAAIAFIFVAVLFLKPSKKKEDFTGYGLYDAMRDHYMNEDPQYTECMTRAQGICHCAGSDRKCMDMAMADCMLGKGLE